MHTPDINNPIKFIYNNYSLRFYFSAPPTSFKNYYRKKTVYIKKLDQSKIIHSFCFFDS